MINLALAVSSSCILTTIAKATNLLSIKIIVSSTDGCDFLKIISQLKEILSVVVVEYCMDIDSIRIIEYFNFLHPSIRILCVGNLRDPIVIQTIFKAGAIGFIGSDFCEPKELTCALKSIIDNKRYFKNAILGEIISDNFISTPSCSDSLLKLSKREKEFLILNATNLTYREIGQLMFIEEKTVEVIAYRLSKKIGIKGGRKNLLVTSIKNGWIQNPI
jgi:DNA-binding NarL/FixJ family response regulator